MNRLFLAISCLCLISCSSKTVIEPWEGYTYAFDKDGRVPVLIKHEKHRYMLHTNISHLRNLLYHTPEGKIDKIIEENPLWQFLIYCRCEVEDSTMLMRLLKKYDCDFPVIIDPDGSFITLNGLDQYTEIGFICDKDNRCYGVSSIGTTQSFFDQEFRKAKSEINDTRF